jgi:hypothetical protein
MRLVPHWFYRCRYGRDGLHVSDGPRRMERHGRMTAHKHGVDGVDFCYTTPGELEQARKDAATVARIVAWRDHLARSRAGWDADIAAEITKLLGAALGGDPE